MRRVLLLVAILALAATASRADIVNGDFESGGTGWTPVGPAEWTYAFPTTGGNPAGRALIQNAPDFVSSGLGCIRQVFECGTQGQATSCDVHFDFLIQNLGMPSTAHLVASIDGQTIYDAPFQSSAASWASVAASVACGTHTLDLCLDVPPGGTEPIFWRASFDNVRAMCVPTVGVERHPWGGVKQIYR